MHYISPENLSIERIKEIITNNEKLALSAESKKLINHCRQYLDKKISESESPVYGINTGFGSLCNVQISNKDLTCLQENLVKSHACGTGDIVSQDISRIMLLLKIHGLSLGKSASDISTINLLIELFNRDIIPVIYQQGSLGASGDLAPLAHMSLVLLGEGEVWENGQIKSAGDVLKSHGLKPLKLKSKEGLALLNGTQFMSGHLTNAVIRLSKLFDLADLIAAVSLDAFSCRLEPFNELLHKIRPHNGQLSTAKKILENLKGSEIASLSKKQVQDPYSFRCIPQVHGASKDVLDYVINTLTTEINSVTDNPTVFPDEDLILSGGNFHGQVLAMAADFLSIAAAEIGSIAERRVYKLISGERELPPFLVANPGLNSGFMIPQYTAASIVSQNKQLCSPASIDSISSSNEQEDHVSMGANAATKLIRITDNLERILAIELFTAMQALDFIKPIKSSDKIEELRKEYRKTVPYIENDTVMYTLIENSLNFIQKL